MITAADTRPEDFFGESVSLHGETILVGASYHDAAGPNHGAAYEFKWESSRWTQASKLLAQIPVVPVAVEGQ